MQDKKSTTHTQNVHTNNGIINTESKVTIFIVIIIKERWTIDLIPGLPSPSDDFQNGFFLCYCH
jgi:hypothetical protein